MSIKYNKSKTLKWVNGKTYCLQNNGRYILLKKHNDRVWENILNKL